MELIYQNPFRILGLPINAKDREIVKRIGDLAIYTDMGKEIDYKADHYFPSKPIRTSESIEEAKQKIDQPSNKLFYALFWFWENSNNTIDEMAFEELQNGHVEKAIEFWEKAIENGITAKNRSNHRNLSTLRLGLSTQGGKLQKHTFLNSLSLSGEFLANGHFEEFASQVLGEQYNVDLLETTSHYVDEIISIAKPHLDKKQKVQKSGKVSIMGITTSELFNNLTNFPTDIGITEKFTGQYIHNIEKQISKSESLRIENPKKTNKAGLELYKTTKDDLKQLENIFSKSNLKYQLIADKLAEELIGCSIDYFNELRDTNTDPSNDTLKLLKYAKKIAVSDKTKNRITDNQPTIEAYVKDKPEREKLRPVKAEFDFIYNKLNTIQSAGGLNPSIAERLINNCKPKLDSIKNYLGKTDDDFIKLSDIVANTAMGLCFELMESIMKRADTVYMSDYEKSTLFGPIISKVEPVFDLVGKLEMSHSVRKNYTDFCNNAGFTPGGPYQRRAATSSSSSSDGGCYIATMVYGSYDAPEVKVLRNFRDEVLLQSKSGKLFVKQYYRFSPGIVEKTKNLKVVHFIFKNILNQVINKIRN